MEELQALGIDYIDIQPKKQKTSTKPIKTRKGGKDSKMSKESTPTKPKRYNKSQGEHIKDIVIAVLVAAIVAFAFGMKFESNQNAKVEAAAQTTAWACNAEDEVVVIDGTCRHIDSLTAETPVKK